MRDQDPTRAPGQTPMMDRRGFLESSAGAAAALSAGAAATTTTAATAPALAAEQSRAAKPPAELPTRTLGKTGVAVSMLNLGTWKSAGGERLLRYAWAQGVRYIDTAQSYGSEPMIGRWLKRTPQSRKDLFLVTKYHAVASPRELFQKIDARLEALQIDRLDLIFLHALGDHDFQNEVKWPASREFRETAEAIKKAGKARFVGFSTHHARRPEILQAAVKGGFVDAIMLQNNPWTAREDAMDRALDACHKAGIGLISMKQVAGNPNLEEIARRLPELKEKGLTPYQGLLHAIWTDERFASVCVSMRNTDQVRENCAAARNFQPMKTAEIERLRDACLAAGPTMCAGCDGRCAAAAGTGAELGNIVRFLTYHEHHGYRAEARQSYAALDEAARDWRGGDLEAARRACPNHLDFATLLPKAERLLS